jgi:hypothetical protein
MNRCKNISRVGMALLIGSAAISVHAEESDITQTRTHDRSRTELNLQVPDSDYGQSRNREEHTVMNQNQNQKLNQYQYKYMKQNKQGNSGVAAMDRINATTRHAQGSVNTSSMSRQNMAGSNAGKGHR